MERFEKAKKFAAEIHKDQKYGENKPYIYHLNKVCDVLRRFGFKEDQNEELFIAGILHDSLEDVEWVTPWTLLKEKFTPREIELIHAVTNETGKNRKERHEKSYPKIVNTADAVIVKLADRIANVEEADKIGMYRKEHQDFSSVLRVAKTNYPYEAAAMWLHLDTLIYSNKENETFNAKRV